MVVNDFGYQNTQQQQQQQPELEDKNDVEMLEWIASVPLSRPVKNLARDFSDAVLMSEVMKLYYPHMVCLRHYISANSVQGKKDNWINLNRRVLSKLDMRLSAEMIEQLVRSKPGIINRILIGLRDKHELPIKLAAPKHTPSTVDLQPPAAELPLPTDHHDLQCPTNTCEEFVEEIEKEEEEAEEKIEPLEPAAIVRVDERPKLPDRPEDIRSVFDIVCYAASAVSALFVRISLALIYFWRWFPVSRTSAKGQSRSVAIKNFDEHQGEKGHEDEEKKAESEMIKMLSAKVSSFEGTIELMEKTIASLTSQLELQRPNAEPAEHSSGGGGSSSSISDNSSPLRPNLSSTGVSSRMESPIHCLAAASDSNEPQSL